ncbi:TPA: hypothetical protein DF272_02475 [Candidatus Falkowbacteria bacterium]|nr:hypothetical protein [Candidatus Falkowbacteria bacterium]
MSVLFRLDPTEIKRRKDIGGQEKITEYYQEIATRISLVLFGRSLIRKIFNDGLRWGIGPDQPWTMTVDERRLTAELKYHYEDAITTRFYHALKIVLIEVLKLDKFN